MRGFSKEIGKTIATGGGRELRELFERRAIGGSFKFKTLLGGWAISRANKFAKTWPILRSRRVMFRATKENV